MCTEGKKGVRLLSGNLDELLEQLDSFIERHTHQDFGHDPLLNLITTLQQDGQSSSVARSRSSAQRVVHQLLLQGENTGRV